jgi:GNAT superfamily N-acetyltransferase
MIRGLAAFERAPDAVRISEETIRADGFGESRRFEVLIGELGGEVAGVLLLYGAYSSWLGAPTMAVHDLFVDDSARGAGLGRSLLTAAARLAAERGCCRLDVNVLDWNRRARRFYEAAGFSPLGEWVPYRLDSKGIARLAGVEED